MNTVKHKYPTKTDKIMTKMGIGILSLEIPRVKLVVIYLNHINKLKKKNYGNK